MPQGKGTYGKQVGRPPKKAYKKGGKAKKYQEGGKILQGAGGTDLRDIDAYGKVSDVARFKKAMDIEAKGSQQEDQVMFQKHQAENRGPGYAGGYDEYSVSRNLDVGDQTAAHNESYELWDKVMKEHPEEFDLWWDSLTDKKINDYFKFIFVRNPFSRLISAWNDIDKPYFPDFGKFIQEGIFDKNGNPKTLHYQLQSSLFETSDNYSLNLDFIGKIENIKDDWKTLCNLTNLSYQELGHYANRNHNHYTTYYTDEVKKIVSDWYRRDLEFFNYNFK